MHVEHISKAFAQGDFAGPHEVHAESPPGVPEMKARKAKITYQYESTPTCARVLITTEDHKIPESHPRLPPLPNPLEIQKRSMYWAD